MADNRKTAPKTRSKPEPFDPKNAGLKALEVELLRLIDLRTSPTTSPRMRDLFGDIVPTWAGSTAERIQDHGHATRDRDGRYSVTDLGRAFVKSELAKESQNGKR